MNIADKLTTIAENQQMVYSAGKVVGINQEKQTFWDNYLYKGYLETFYGVFAGGGWNSKTFYPMCKIKPVTAKKMFWYFGQMPNTDDVDLVQRLEECGVTLDFSKCTDFTNAFGYSRISRVGKVDTRSCEDLTKIFANSNLATIDLLVLNSSYKTWMDYQTFGNAFQNCEKLQNITIKGCINYHFDIQWSTELTYESLISILEALRDNSGPTDITWSLRIGKVNKAKLTEDDLYIAEQKGWVVV